MTARGLPSCVTHPSCMRRNAVGATRTIVVLTTCLHLLYPAAGQGFIPSNPTVGATEVSSQLQQQYKNSLAWRRSYKLKPAAACSTHNSANLCGAASTKDADAYAQLTYATSPPAYSSRDTKWTAGVTVVAPAQDQQQCDTCVAFAVSSAAETAMASVLHVDAAECSISVQSLYFCPQNGDTRGCRGGWTLQEALTDLRNRGQSLPTAGCLPYNPDITGQYSYAALCSGSCTSTSKYASQGVFTTVQISTPGEAQQHIRQYGSVVTRFDVYNDLRPFFSDSSNAEAVYRPKPGAKVEMRHAIVLVGYDNNKQYWIAKNSWGPKWADAGFFKVAYDVCSLLTPDSGEASGVIWTLRGDNLLPASKSQSLKLLVEAGPNPGCYFYKARPGDYLSKVAWLAKIPLHRFVADNTAYAKDLDASLEGTKLLLCNPQPGTFTTGATNEKDPQLEALLTIKSYIDKNNVLLGWSQASGQNGGYCTWRGVVCNSNAVVGLDLWHDTVQGLQGTLPPAMAFAGLQHLNWLILRDQPGIGGAVPDWSSLGRISFISLLSDGLTGTLPPSLSKLTQLKTLYLTSNKLSGTIPDSWQALNNLEDLQIGSNLLTGTVPAWLGSFSNLRVLGLSRCKLSGSVPSSMARMASLQTLWLYKNPKLRGCIPLPLQGQLAGTNFYSNVLAGTQITGFCS